MVSTYTHPFKENPIKNKKENFIHLPNLSKYSDFEKRIVTRDEKWIRYNNMNCKKHGDKKIKRIPSYHK